MVAAVEPDANTLRRFQSTWNVPNGYRSLREIQDDEPLDVVSICSPDALHYCQAVQLATAAARPRVLLLEKPVCLEDHELIHLANLAEDAGVAVAVNHTRRFDPAHRQVAQLVQSGTLGPLLHGRCTYYGGWLHNGPHIVDTLRMLFAGEPRVVSAASSPYQRLEEQDLDVHVRVDGAAVDIQGFDDSHYQLFESEFRFQSGRVRLLDFGRTIAVEEMAVNQLGERVLRAKKDSPQKGLVSSIYHAVEAIDAHLQGNDTFKDLGVDLTSAAETMRVVWKATEMAQNAGSQ